MGLVGQKAALPQAMAQLAGRPGAAVLAAHVTPPDRGVRQGLGTGPR